MEITQEFVNKMVEHFTEDWAGYDSAEDLEKTKKAVNDHIKACEEAGIKPDLNDGQYLDTGRRFKYVYGVPMWAFKENVNKVKMLGIHALILANLINSVETVKETEKAVQLRFSFDLSEEAIKNSDVPRRKQEELLIDFEDDKTIKPSLQNLTMWIPKSVIANTSITF